MTTGVALLGSTGSVGVQTIDVVRAAEGRYRLVALAARRPGERIAAQAREFRPRRVAVFEPDGAAELAAVLPAGVELAVGPEAVAELATLDDADVVMNAVAGSVGLAPTLAALDAGRRLALANKESLIVGGELVRGRARPGQIVPVDSEHSGLAQCLRAGDHAEVQRLIVTASGGPFRGRSAEQLADVAPADALRHPTWDMGPLVTINSATLFNKALEVIEAHLLFDIPYDRIEVVVQPQSIVHALVEFVDGSTVAQVSQPDMRLPIGLALGWPERARTPYGRMDWSVPLQLEFEPVDHATFPLLGLTIAAGREGGTAPGIANAANEEAVAAFLAGKLRFSGIAETVASVLERRPAVAGPPDLAALLAAERWSRERARTLVEEAPMRTRERAPALGDDAAPRRQEE